MNDHSQYRVVLFIYLIARNQAFVAGNAKLLKECWIACCKPFEIIMFNIADTEAGRLTSKKANCNDELISQV